MLPAILTCRGCDGASLSGVWGRGEMTVRPTATEGVLRNPGRRARADAGAGCFIGVVLGLILWASVVGAMIKACF